jgi:hypothetical protein
MVRVIFFSLLGPVALSSFVPMYFGYVEAPYSTAIIWALVCTLWWVRPSLGSAETDANWLQPLWYKSTAIAAMVAVVALAFVSGDSIAYILTRSISSGGVVVQTAASSATCDADCATSATRFDQSMTAR